MKKRYPKINDGLMGKLTHAILARDGFKCVYCGLEGSELSHWLHLSVDHLLPKGHANRENPEFVVTACRFCNGTRNRTLFDVNGKPRKELIDQKRPVVLERRKQYEDYWNQKVRTNRGKK
ncbi:MAG: hypothetical protein HY707_06090 [Ignavibacteriae bacterium]|nr:hypothetical protein [Ignavibacteriota bacterium]